jgi:hypothetical protein
LKKVKVKFFSLLDLAECMNALAVGKPEINYTDRTVEVELEETLIPTLREFGGEIISIEESTQEN